MRPDSITEQFTQNNENTMNTALANSVGMLLLSLKQRYFPKASESKMEQHYQSTLKALNVLAQIQNDPARKASLSDQHITYGVGPYLKRIKGTPNKMSPFS